MDKLEIDDRFIPGDVVGCPSCGAQYRLVPREPKFVSVGSANRTEPPRPWRKHLYHWLYSERATDAVVAYWKNGHWYCVAEVAPVTPEDMRIRGWEWLVPAIPPQIPE